MSKNSVGNYQPRKQIFLHFALLTNTADPCTQHWNSFVQKTGLSTVLVPNNSDVVGSELVFNFSFNVS